MKESYLNCAHEDGCLLRSTTLFQLFIVSGREQMAAEAMEKMNIQPSYTNWKMDERLDSFALEQNV